MPVCTVLGIQQGRDQPCEIRLTVAHMAAALAGGVGTYSP
jgi:hypothetical protein